MKEAMMNKAMALCQPKARTAKVLVRCLGAALFALSAFSVTAFAQVTSLTMTGDPSDYIGGGQFYFYTPADGAFMAQQNSGQGVSVSFHTPAYEHWWNLDFAAPSNQPLTPGTYTGAVRFPFQASNQPGLSVSGDGRGCNTLTGSFQVLEATYGSAAEVLTLDAIFEQHCEGGTPALRGEIRYNANVAVDVTAPTRLTALENQTLSFSVMAADSQSRHVSLSATGLPAGATFFDNGDNTGTFTWTPTGSQGGSYLITFQGDNLQGNIGATYTQIQVMAPPPPNDDFDDATVVHSIPNAVSQDVTNATTSGDDPATCYGYGYQTVWFAYTSGTNARLEANTFGSTYQTVLTVNTGTRGALTQIGCNAYANGTLNSRVRFDAVAGATYYFMVSSPYPGSSANLSFNLQEAPPPFSFAPTVSQFGSVSSRSGTVTLSGSVTCSSASYVTISGWLTQMHGSVPVNGYFSALVPCDGTTPWSTSVQSQSSLFHGRAANLFTGGKASVLGDAWAFDPDTGEYRQMSIQASVTLRGAK